MPPIRLPNLPAGNSLAGLLVGNLLRGGGTKQGTLARQGTGGGDMVMRYPPGTPIPPALKALGNQGGGSSRPGSAPPKSGPKAFDPTTSNFGLNLNDKTPFDPLNPDVNTVGGFNRQVLAAAQPQYLPQLQGIQGQMSAENTAGQQRVTDLGSIYAQYQQQAQDAYNQVQQSLANLAAQTGAGSSPANLASALSSTLTPQSNLDQMMGASAPSQLPGGAGQASQIATQQELNSAGAGALGLQGANLANVGNERATELNTESLRHQAANQSLQQQQQALVEQIPGIIEKARQQLLSDAQSAQSLRFQEGLASQQFGLQAQAQGFNQQQTAKQFGETQKNDAANRAAQAAQIQQNAQALQNQEAATNAAAAQALAKAQGTAQANAIKYLQGALTPSKDQLRNWTTTDASGTKRTGQTLANPGAWHVDVGSVLDTLMNQYGVTQAQALRMMADLGGRVYVSGQRGQTVADWANTFLQRQAAQRQRKPITLPQTPLANAWSNITGGISSGVG